MDLVASYRRQFAWRDWPRALATLPDLRGQTVLDLGCGVGDLAAELATRGARVLGFDGNEELLAAACARKIPHAEFYRADLRALPARDRPADGAWASFAAAYFCDLAPVLQSWREHLRPGGWIALTEIDDLFGHEPVSPRTRALLSAYAEDALRAGRYDFAMGRKLADGLHRAGFTVGKTLQLDDREFAGTGPLPPDVLAAWRERLERMRVLHAFCGGEYPAVRDDLLACLVHPAHRSSATVRFVLATAP